MVRAFIREVILENFMSYEYSRIAFKPGLNVVIGPNGAGKSTILIAISIALGQSFTERARKLSDLVRRGNEMARVTLVLDNSPRDGKRPLPYKKDTVLLSRYIRKDGGYWFEIDYKEVSKIEVVETLRKLGLNPENMLVIMPQGFIDRFIVMNPEEKLKMVEEAVGIASVREDLKDAKERLESILKDEEEYQTLLERAMESMEKWREQYERLLEYRRLSGRLRELALEKAWANVDKAGKALQGLKERKERLESELKRLEAKLEEADLRHERLKGQFDKMVDGLVEELGPLQEAARRLGYAMASGKEEDERALTTKFSKYLSKLKKLPDLADLLAEAKAKAEVLRFRVGQVKNEIRKVERDMMSAKSALEEAERAARLVGKRPETLRPFSEVEEEERTIKAQLKTIGTVAEEAEKAFLEFKKKMEEYKDKLEKVRENKAATLKEIAEKGREWRTTIRKLLKKIDAEFQTILETINAHGHVELINEEEPERAGLILKLGVKGLPLVPLDVHTQSGGEKSATVMAFLLAIQKHVVSPFRAVDEFDVHMDPVNRELFFKAIHSYFKGEGEVQYVIITPGHPPFYDPDVHYIMVQKTVKGSEVKVVAHEAR